MSDLNTERFLFTEPMFVHTNVYPNAESMKPILTIVQTRGVQFIKLEKALIHTLIGRHFGHLCIV